MTIDGTVVKIDADGLKWRVWTDKRRRIILSYEHSSADFHLSFTKEQARLAAMLLQGEAKRVEGK